VLDENLPLDRQHVNLEKMAQYNCSNLLQFASSMFKTIVRESSEFKELCSNLNNKMATNDENIENYRHRLGTKLNLPTKFEKFDSAYLIKHYDYKELIEFEKWAMNLPDGDNKYHIKRRIKKIRSSYRDTIRFLKNN